MSESSPDHLITQLIHQRSPLPTGFMAATTPIHKASSVFFGSMADLRARDWQADYDYSYGLHGTPTTFELADRIARLEGGQYCLLAPSGLSALSVVNLALLKHGDEVLLPDNVYAPGLDLVKRLMAQYGISYCLYDPLLPEQLEIHAHTRLLWLEAAGSITMEFPALRALIAKAKAHGVLTALDNTWGAGLAFCAFDYAVDISVHALTKYPSGGADVLMGSIVTRDRALHLQLKDVHAQLGIGIAANDAELVLRNLPTLLLRYQQQDQNARQLAEWLANQPQIAQVLHPARLDNAGYAEWLAVCGQTDLAAGLFSVIFRAEISQAQVDQFCDALRLFKIGFSWGGPISLVMGYNVQAIRPQQPAHLQHGCLVRLSIGLENLNDLQQDLAQALLLLQ